MNKASTEIINSSIRGPRQPHLQAYPQLARFSSCNRKKLGNETMFQAQSKGGGGGGGG